MVKHLGKPITGIFKRSKLVGMLHWKMRKPNFKN